MTCTPLFLFWCVYKNAKISSKSPSNGHTCGIYAQLLLLCAAPVIYDHVVQENPRGISALGGQNSPKTQGSSLWTSHQGSRAQSTKMPEIRHICDTKPILILIKKNLDETKLHLYASGSWYCLTILFELCSQPPGSISPPKLNFFLSFDRY